jgi:hypothetical protein
MDEADVPLKLFHASILDIYKEIESLGCCLKGTWVHPYTITPARLAPDLGTQGQLDWIVVTDCAAAVDAAATILSLLLMAAALLLLTVRVTMAVVDGGDSGRQQRRQRGARVMRAGADNGVRESVRPTRARGQGRTRAHGQGQG